MVETAGSEDRATPDDKAGADKPARAGGAVDYFISRRGSAAAVAQEVADVLKAAGYSSFSQEYDVPHSANFVAAIHVALKRCRHFIALLTRDYDEAEWTLAEWSSFYAAAISDKERRFIVIRVEACEPPGLLAGIVFADLVGVQDPRERRKRIITAVEGRSIATPRLERLFENVPPRDLNFTGRDNRLSELHKLLMDTDRPAAITQAAIHGLGGIGKTSLAAEYVHRYAGAYAGVWWAPAEQRTVLVASLAALAGRMDQGLADEPDQEKAARAGLAHLAAHAGLPFLLVYDNVETPEMLDGLLPSTGVRVLVTTRWPDWSGRGAEVRLDVLAPDRAADFLQKRARRSDPTGAARLAKALGYLPLALDHAGAYCALDASMSFDAYREKIDRRIARRPKGALYPDSVAKTFDLAIDKAAAETKAAETLLGFFAYLAPERIPLDLVSDEIVGEEDRSEALIALAGVSLIERAALDDGAPAVTLHRLVQAAMRARLVERGETAATVERVTKRLADAFPNDGYDEPKRWPRCAALLPHVMALREHALWVGGSAEAGGTLLNSAGSYLEGRAAHAEAEPLFREALAIGEKTLGREHPNVVAVLNNLANLLRDTGRHAEAEPLIREALAISEKSLGREHPEIAIRLNVLALLLRQTGRHTEAEQLYREAIAISEKTSRREHPVVAIGLSSLANLLSETGRHSEAEPLLREALTINEKTVDPDHPNTALTQWSLAALFLATKRPVEALPFAETALAVFEKTFGAEHPRTKDCALTCAAVLAALGRNAEAAALRAKYGLD